MIEFICSNEQCSFSKSVDEKHLGVKAKCPKCGTVTGITNDEPVLEFTLWDEPVPICNQGKSRPVFDESKTFAFMGDFLGSTIEQFRSRHRTDDPSDFSIVWSDTIPPEEYDFYGIEQWTHKEPRITTCAASGSRLAIVGVPLRVGLYTFLDEELFSIVLETRNASLDVSLDIYRGLAEAFGEHNEAKNIGEAFRIATWKRPHGNLNSVITLGHVNPVQIRYVNIETYGEFDTLWDFHNVSEANADSAPRQQFVRHRL